jgi:hypothetical protein
MRERVAGLEADVADLEAAFNDARSDLDALRRRPSTERPVAGASFGAAVGAATGASFGIGLGYGILLLLLVSQRSLLALSALSELVVVSVAGTGMLGAAAGLGAAMRAPSRTQAAGAGLIGGVLGHLATILLLFGIIAASYASSVDSRQIPFDPGAVGKVLVFLVPTGIAAAFVGACCGRTKS